MTSRLNLAAPAIRPALKGRLLLAAPSGAGKTKTGLIIATVLAADDDGSIVVIDTEKESALTYADDFDFKHIPWRPPYDVAELAETITDAGRTFSVVMVDSMSHFWRKAGGTLDVAGGKFGGWKKARPLQEDLVDAILACDAHVILCARSKQAHVQEEDERGRQVVKKLGMAAQQDDDLEYEMNIGCEIDMEHTIAVSKSRCDAVPVGRQFTAGHAGELAELYRDWLKVGEPPAPQAAVDALTARIGALPEADRKACKGEFMATLGRPELLREARLSEAEALVAGFEGRGGGGGDGSVSGSAAAPPPPENENPTQKGGGDDDSTGKGSPGGQPTAAGPGESSSEAESEPPPARQGAEEASVSSAPSGITADMLRAAVALTHPDRDTTRKQEITATKLASELAFRRQIDGAGGTFADLVANQTLAAALLEELDGDDKPPPSGGKGPVVGEQPPAQAPGSGPASADPAPTTAPTDPVPYKTTDRAKWNAVNRFCRKVQSEYFAQDKETADAQWEALAYACSGGRTTHLAELTEAEILGDGPNKPGFRQWCDDLAKGRGRWVETADAAWLGWTIDTRRAA